MADKNSKDDSESRVLRSLFALMNSDALATEALTALDQSDPGKNLERIRDNLEAIHHGIK
jgi:hypothetical protein